MTTQQLKSEITKISISEKISFIDACKAMQAAAAKLGNEEMILKIHKIKMSAL
jgi:hypothetical protein